MALRAIETVTQLESKIIGLARHQYNCGDRGGTFTPGFVRKETGQGYDAINFAFSSLVGSGFLEKNRTTTYRQGAPADIDIYRITERGLQAFERIEKGLIRIEDRQLPGNYQGGRPNERGNQPGAGRGQGHSPELHQSVKRLEATLGEISAKLAELHDKLDRKLGMISTKPASQQAAVPVPVEASKADEKITNVQPKARKGKKPSSSLVQRNVFILESVKELSKDRKFLLANDVKERYVQKCKAKGVAPKGAEQFTVFLNRFKADGLLSVKKMGCKAIGIEGRASRLVIEMTPEGEEYLVKNGKDFRIDGDSHQGT
jgi:DNA-binding PadR family transcriptional regulator